jgi:hypothetical protein
VEKGVKSNAPTHFNIDCRQAGPGKTQLLFWTRNFGRNLFFRFEAKNWKI